MKTKVDFKQGDKKWKEWRHKATVPIPGKRSALWFLMCNILGLKDKVPLTPEAHYAYCLFVERATGIPEIDECRAQMALVARAFGKSIIQTQARTLQQLLQNRDYSVMITNETQNLANKFLGQIKMWFEQNDLIRFLWPECIPDFGNTTWKADEIVINRSLPHATAPSILAVGVGGTRTGIHVDEIKHDDLISKNAAENARKGLFTEIEDANLWYVQTHALLHSPERDKVSVTGTPWYAGDTYEFVEKYYAGISDDVELESVPPDFETLWHLKLPNGKRQTIKLYRRGDLAVFKRPALEEGESIYPEKWSTEELQAMSVRPKVAEWFQANYMLEPAAGLAAAFKADYIRYYDLDSTRKSITYYDHSGSKKVVRVRDLVTFISVDPAFSDSREGARTAIPVVGTDGSNLFLLEDFAEHGLGPGDIAAKVAEFAARYRPNTIFVETIVAQRALLEPIRAALAKVRISRTLITEISSHGKTAKEMRIWGLEPWFKSGQFYVHRSHSKFLREYTTFPRSALRDILDAISFQRDEWERVAGSTSRGQQDYEEADRRAIERMKASMSPHGGY